MGAPAVPFSVTPPRYGVPMIKTNPTPAMTDAEIEAWFGEAGLSVSVVERCPLADCDSCSDSHADPPAKAA